jgi:uncharacterized membrane protein
MVGIAHLIRREDSDVTTSKHREPDPVSAERLKAFTDAVVAIAMTLLILPLMDSIGDADSDGWLTLDWLAGESPQLFSFVLSFLLIADFWIMHHRLFDRVERVTVPLLWLTVAWMFTIVWLPVATALLGQLEVDAAQKVLYIGSLLVTSLVLLATRVYIRRHPGLHSTSADRLSTGMRGSIVSSSLFALALVLAVAVPSIGYWAMLLLLLTRPISRLTDRWGARG